MKYFLNGRIFQGMVLVLLVVIQSCYAFANSYRESGIRLSSQAVQEVTPNYWRCDLITEKIEPVVSYLYSNPTKPDEELIELWDKRNKWMEGPPPYLDGRRPLEFGANELLIVKWGGEGSSVRIRHEETDFEKHIYVDYIEKTVEASIGFVEPFESLTQRVEVFFEQRQSTGMESIKKTQSGLQLTAAAKLTSDQAKFHPQKRESEDNFTTLLTFQKFTEIFSEASDLPTEIKDTLYCFPFLKQ